LHLEGLERILLSPTIPAVQDLHLDAEDWLSDKADGRLTGDDNPHVVAFVRRLGASPKAAKLDYLHFGYMRAGPEIVQAFLDSPYFAMKEQLCLFVTPRLGKGPRQGLKKRFGKALRLN
jgi:hypothetical protein